MNDRIDTQVVGSEKSKSRRFRSWLAAAGCGMALLICAPSANAQNVSLNATDAINTTSFNTAGHWNNGAAPAAGNAYFTANFTLRSPTATGSFTFLGDSLSLDTGGAIGWKGASTTGGVMTFPALVFNGGNATVSNGNTSYTLAVSTGSIVVNAPVSFASGAASGDTRTTIINSPITGAGQISISNPTAGGISALTLTGANGSFSGGISIGTGGTLNANGAAALGTGALTINGGTLNNSSAAAITLSTNPPQNWNGDFVYTGTRDLNMGTGLVVLNGNRIVTVNASTLTEGGVIDGPFGITKAGNGSLALVGANTYQGTTTINAGTLALTGGGSIFNVASNAITVNAGATLSFARNDTWGNSAATVLIPILINGGTVKNGATNYNTLGPITFNGGVLNSTGGLSPTFQAFGLKGTVTVAGAAAATISGSGTNSAFHLGEANVTAVTFDVGDVAAGTDLTVAAVLMDGRDAGDTVFQPGGLIKTGAGTMLLAASNLYTGPTTISNGVVSTPVLANGGISSGIGQSAPDAANLILDGGRLQYTGTTININRSFTLAAGKTGTIDVASVAANLTLSGTTAPTSGSLIKAGLGTLTLTGANTYTGATTISEGVLSVPTVADGGVVSAIGQSSNAPGNLVLDGGTLQFTGTTINSNRAFTLTDTKTSSIDVATPGANLSFSGASASTTGSLTKIGAGTLTLTGANAYSGTTTVAAGKLVVNGLPTGSGPYTVGTGAILAGSGTLLGSVTSNGGSINPGAEATPGKLTLSNAVALVMDSATSLNLRLTGAATATIGSAGNDGIEASGGSVDLGGAQLNLSGLTVTGTRDFHVIHAGTLTGTVTIASAPAGYVVNPVYDTVSVPNALILHITQATVRKWTGLGSDSKWSTAANWDAVPVGNANETLLFPAVAKKTTTVDAPFAGKSFGAIVFQDGGYVLDGVALKSAGTTPFISNTSGANSILVDLVLASDNAIVNTGGALTVGTGTNAITNGGFTLALGGSGAITVNSVIAGTGGLTCTNQGTSTLTALNTYTGKTTLSSGTLSVATIANGGVPCGLGAAAAAGNLDLGAATLQYTGTGDSSDRAIKLTGAGILNASGTGALILSGGISAATAQNLTLSGSGDATESGSIATFAGTLTKSGANTWVLSGANSYSGVTNFNGGVLSVSGFFNLGDASPANTMTFNGGTLRATDTFDTGPSRAVVINANGGTFDVKATFTATISGAISGLGNVTKTGPGTLILSGSNANSGTVTITGGVVSVGASTNLGNAAASNGLILDGGTLSASATLDLTPTRSVILNAGGGTFDVAAGAIATVSGVISGAGSLTKTGPGTLALTAVNTNSGAVNLNGGTVNITALTGLGDGSAGNTLGFDGGALMTSASINLGARALTLNAGGGTLDAAATFTMTVPGVISGAGGLTIRVNNSVVLLSGTNTYTGPTVVNTYAAATNAGTLRLASAGALGQSSGITLNNAVFNAGGLQGTTLDLTGGFTYSGVPLNMNSGTGNFRVTLSNGSGSNVWASNIVVNGSSLTQFYNNSAGTFTITGNITAGAGYAGQMPLRGGGAGLASISGTIDLGTASLGLSKTDASTWQINSTGNNWTQTNIQVGILRLGMNDALPVASTLLMAQADASNCSLDLNGFNQTLTSITNLATATGGTKAITNVSATPSLLTINIQAFCTYGTATSGGNAILSGNLSLAKNNTGILILTNTNSYTGSTTINDGLLQAGIANTIPPASAVSIGNVATAVFDMNNFNQTIGSLAGGGAAGGSVLLGTATLTSGGNNSSTSFDGIISGSGGLSKAGSGILTLSGINTFTGAMIIGAGTIAASADANLGAGTAVTAVTFSATSTGALRLTGATFNSSKGIFMSGPGTLDVGGTDEGTWSGVISGPGVLTKTGTGKVVLSGTNTYTGVTAVGGGILSVTGESNLGSTSPLAAVALAGGTLQAAATFTTARVLNITAATGNLDVTAGNSLTVGTPIPVSSGALAKTGAGALILTGAQGYTGGTIVSGGALRGTPSALGDITLFGNAAVFPGTIAIVGPNSLDLGSNPILAGASINFSPGAKLQAILTTTGTLAHGTQVSVTGTATVPSGVGLSFGVTSGTYPAGDIVLLSSSGAAPGIIAPFTVPAAGNPGALPVGMALVYLANNGVVANPSAATPADTVVVRVATTGNVTPVKLDDFAAHAQGAGVVLDWTAVSEFKNAGFNVYRRSIEPPVTVSGWTRINSALIAGRITNPDEKKYRFHDWAQPGIYEYKLESVAIGGEREDYALLAGPAVVDADDVNDALTDEGLNSVIVALDAEFSATRSCALSAKFVAEVEAMSAVGNVVIARKADGSLVLPTKVKALARNAVASEVAAASLKSDVSATALQAAGARWFSASPASSTASFTGAKVEYTSAGVLLIPKAMLPAGLDIGHLSIQREGRPLTALARTSDGLLVYGQGYQDEYTNTDAIFLRNSSAATATGQLTQATGLFESAQKINDDTPASTTVDYHDVYFDFNLRPYTFAPWFSSQYLAGNTTQSFAIEAPFAASGAGTLTINLWSLTQSATVVDDHALQVLVNGLPVGQTVWSGGNKMMQVTLQIPSGILIAGSNQVELVTPALNGVDSQIALLHSMTMSYTRTLDGSTPVKIVNNSATSKVYELSRLPGANAWVVDARYPERAALVPAETQAGADGTYRLRFVANAGGTGEYLVVPAGQEYTPLSVSRRQIKPLRLDGTYLATGPSRFAQSVQPLLTHRTKEGIRSQFVDQEQLFDYYNYGRFGPGGIQKAVRATRPQYLLLLGRTTYDYLNQSGAAVDPLCPAFLVSTSFWAQTTSDSAFGDLGRSGSGAAVYPEVAVGRIPANNEAELSTAVSHILNARGLPASGIRAHAVSDAADPLAADFAQQLAGLAQNHPEMVWQTNALGVTLGTAAEVNAVLTNAANGGADLILYNGHGNTVRLGNTNSRILDTGSVQNWQGNVVFLQSTCASAWIANNVTGWKSIAMQALTQPQGGISASIGTSTYMNADAGVAFMDQLLKNTAGHGTRWGRALMQTQQWAQRQGTGFYTDLGNTEQLFGDPAMPVFITSQPAGSKTPVQSGASPASAGTPGTF